MTMQITESYLHWTALASEGRVNVFQVKKTTTFRVPSKEKIRQDEHQILVFHGDIDPFSIWPLLTDYNVFCN